MTLCMYFCPSEIDLDEDVEEDVVFMANNKREFTR